MEKKICPKCESESKMDHRIREAHGISGTYMAGSEHYKCFSCGVCIYSQEGKKLGLEFNFE